MSSEITQNIAKYKDIMKSLKQGTPHYLYCEAMIFELEKKLPKVKLHVAEEAMCESCQ